ncbi:MAG: hypothetical protein LBH70_09520 [Spirochaetaceae bacterium]|jgi:hypothetical protein|nr:hypothetical protein [Spirochaetaceae bacterium]
MKNQHGVGCMFTFILLILPFPLEAESLRVSIAGSTEVVLGDSEKQPIPLSYTDSALIRMDEDSRFFRAVEVEFMTPQNYLPYQGSLALEVYADLNAVPDTKVADIEARRIFFEPIPNKILNVYQIPIKQGHGLKTSPYVTVLPETVFPPSFPVLFRVVPTIKGVREEIEAMRFSLRVKPILGTEGAVRLIPKYPENLRDRPFTVHIDDMVIENPNEELMLKEGEHHLVILSNDYRNENRVFVIERGKTLELTIALQDPTPRVIFEAPETARIFFDDHLVVSRETSMPAAPGVHAVKFELSDYSIVKSLTVQKGKTYRVSMAVDVQISEND